MTTTTKAPFFGPKKPTTAILEYRELSIDDKLLFDPGSRPGCVWIREDRDRLAAEQHFAWYRALPMRRRLRYDPHSNGRFRHGHEMIQADQSRLSSLRDKHCMGHIDKVYRGRLDVRPTSTKLSKDDLKKREWIIEKLRTFKAFDSVGRLSRSERDWWDQFVAAVQRHCDNSHDSDVPSYVKSILSKEPGKRRRQIESYRTLRSRMPAVSIHSNVRDGKVWKGATTTTSAAMVDESEENWNRYSKSWHRKYGPATEVYDRRVILLQTHGDSFRWDVVGFKSWAGDVFVRAIEQSKFAPRGTQAPMKVRLRKAYRAKQIRCPGDDQLWVRTLLGAPVDMVIVDRHGNTFHDDCAGSILMAELIRRGKVESMPTHLREELDEKLASRSKRSDPNAITMNSCRALGFCRAGIQDFCDQFGFDSSGTYIAQEVYDKLSSIPKHLLLPFARELRVLARSVGAESLADQLTSD